MAKVPNGVETLPKISIPWVGRTNVTDDRRQTDRRTIAYSERKLTFTFAKNVSWLNGLDIVTVTIVTQVSTTRSHTCLMTTKPLVSCIANDAPIHDSQRQFVNFLHAKSI